jgi:hypothetical protein
VTVHLIPRSSLCELKSCRRGGDYTRAARDASLLRLGGARGGKRTELLTYGHYCKIPGVGILPIHTPILGRVDCGGAPWTTLNDGSMSQ